jgi:hypothetical protein
VFYVFSMGNLIFLGDYAISAMIASLFVAILQYVGDRFSKARQK